VTVVLHTQLSSEQEVCVAKNYSESNLAV